MQKQAYALRSLIGRPIRFDGSSVVLLDVVNAAHPKDWNHGSHYHPWYEFNYLEEGALYTTLEGVEFLSKKGQFFLIPPGKIHSHRNYNGMGDDGFCMRWSLKPEGGPVMGESAGILSVSHPSPGLYPFDRIFGALPLDNEWSRQGAMIQLLLGICAVYSPGRGAPSCYSQEETLVNQAIMYLSQYYERSIKVEEVANSLNVSYRHLARIFKSVTGQSIIQKLNEIRLEEAKRLLAETSLPVGEIAKQVGYSNEYYFSATFKQLIAETPSQYRAAIKSRQYENYASLL